MTSLVYNLLICLTKLGFVLTIFDYVAYSTSTVHSRGQPFALGYLVSVTLLMNDVVGLRLAYTDAGDRQSQT